MFPAGMPTSSKADGSSVEPRPANESCPVCGGFGVIGYDVPLDDPRFGKAYPCPTCGEQRRKERRDVLRPLSNLDDYADKTFESFQVELRELNKAQQESLVHAWTACRAFAESPNGWLLLQGSYGCGKTHLAAAIANARVEAGQPTLFITVPDLLDHLRSTFAPDAEVDYDSLFERVRTISLLVLDDLGAESPTPWAQEKLYQIVNFRYARRLPTVFTTNVELDRLDPRIASRLSDIDVTTRVNILAPDFRDREARAGEATYLRLYTDLTFESWDARPNLPKKDRDNLQRALNQARAFAMKPSGWLVLTGSYSCGKTHLAAAIANHRQASGEAALIVNVPDLLDYLRATFGPESRASYDRRFNELRNAPLLVLDQLGVENPSSWAREKLFQLLEHRFLAKLPTVITTNLSLEELDQKDPRLASRIRNRSRCIFFAITAPEYRGKEAPPAARTPRAT